MALSEELIQREIQNPSLSIQQLSCRRGNRLLFSNLNVDLKPGDCLQVIGANGSGKTSLLKILCGLLVPAKGQIKWRLQSIKQNLAEYQQEILYLGHLPGVKKELTVLENIQFYLAILAINTSPEIDSILHRFSLQNLKHTLCRQLSRGQIQRVALCRLCLTDAPLWILDEPFTALDKTGVAILQQLLIEHQQRQRMVILTSHLVMANHHVTTINLDDFK